MNPGRRATFIVCAHTAFGLVIRVRPAVSSAGGILLLLLLSSSSPCRVVRTAATTARFYGIIAKVVVTHLRRASASHAEKETDTDRRPGGSATGHPDMRHDMRVPDDGRVEQRGHSVPDSGHIHANHAGVQVRHIGRSGGVHHH